MIRLINQSSKDHKTNKSHKTSKISPTSKSHQTKIAHPASRINPAFEKARKQLRGLSNKKLLSDLEALNQRERKLKVHVLLYLSEIDTRALYLPMGYSSLFEFCTGHLGYTRATAARRIRSARAAARYPEALTMLRSGEINITTLSMISDILNQENHDEILSEIRSRSTRQVELLVSRHRPVHVIRDTVRPVCVVRRMLESGATCGASGDKISSLSAETELANRCNSMGDESPDISKSSPSAGTRSGNQDTHTDDGHNDNNSKSSLSAETKLSASGHSEKIILEQRLKLGFSVSPEFINKYNKIKSLISSRHPEGINFEMLFDIIMTEYLEKHDPEKRHHRRTKRTANREKTVKHDPEKRSISHRNSRHISPAVRYQVYTRDKGRCTFVGANGKRCNSTWDLKIDHVILVARGGDNSPKNLRLLCRKHNSYQADKTYGREFMRDRIMKE